jgi:hypothetical protein
MEMLKKRQTALEGREGEIGEEAVEAKDLLDRQKYLTLLNVGAAIASPQGGTQGFIPDITKALASQTDKFSALMDKEADIAKEKREKLDKLSDRQLDNMARQRGISREALDREIEAEKLSLQADIKYAEANASAAEAEVAYNQGVRKEFREAQELEADLLAKQAAKIKAQKPEQMTSSDYRALKGVVATRLQAVVDDLGNITLSGGRPLEEAQATEAVGLLELANAEFNKVLKETGDVGNAYTAATALIKQRPTTGTSSSGTSGSGTPQPPIIVENGKAYARQPDGSYKASDGTILQQ